MVTGETITWGILSTGLMATAFVEDLKLLPDARVAAVGSRSPEAARRFAERHDIPTAHGDWAALAADPEVDVVYVATPHSAHDTATALCLAAGKAVLCEKPFTLNLGQARSLVLTARERGLFLMEAMWTYCNPVIRRMLELIADGAIGEVRSVHADFGFVAPSDPRHRLRDPEQGGGALLDLGVYPISLAHLVLGPPDEVTAWAKLTADGVDENTGVLLGYDSGALAALSCSLVADHATAAVVSGTAGRIVLPRMFFRAERLVLHRTGRDPEEFHPPLTAGQGYTHEAIEVMRCLREGLIESPWVPLAGSLAVMATLDRVREHIGVRYPQERH